MTLSSWTEADSKRALEIWSEYQQQHADISDKTGMTAGIEPVSGRIWFGDSIQDVIARRDGDGSDAPLFFMRVGSASYFRKGRSPLIEGVVTEDGVPAIFVDLGNQRWEAIIDTGFNGDLELPEPLRMHADPQVRRPGDLNSGRESTHRGRRFSCRFPIRWPDGSMQATFVDGEEILIGNGLLRDYRLQVDFPAKRVAVERA